MPGKPAYEECPQASKDACSIFAKHLEKGGTFGRLLLTAIYACAVTCAPARASSSGVVCLLAMSRLFRGASSVVAAAPAPSLTNGTPPAKLQKSTHVLVQLREV